MTHASGAGLLGEPQYDVTNPHELRELIGNPHDTSARRLKFTKTLTDTQIDFIKMSQFCILASVGEDGVPVLSPKGDKPGFVKVVSPSAILLPDRPGNKLIFGLLNILQNSAVQLLFLIPRTCETLRISGSATLSRDPALCNLCAAGGQDATLVIRIQISECYYHCAKALLRSRLWEPETWPEGRFNVRLGSSLAKNAGEGSDFAKMVDERYSGIMQEVAMHYNEKVWQLKPSQTGKEKVPYFNIRSAALVVGLAAAAVVLCSSRTKVCRAA